MRGNWGVCCVVIFLVEDNLVELICFRFVIIGLIRCSLIIVEDFNGF